MAKAAFIVALAILLGNTLAAPHNTFSPIITLDNVKYLGHHNATLSINEYYSIPYAAPPVGSLRWRSPQPYGKPSNLTNFLINATQPGASCVQGFPFWSGGSEPVPKIGSEDCLILHVFTPDTATAGAQLPVLFSIHGGGYTLGDATLARPYVLMRHSKNAFIYVSIQYRLGAYGFIGGSQYAKDGGAQNVGLQDQRFALEWTQKNIAAFGGDPEKVTILGGSAGGGSVTSMLAWKGGTVDKKQPFRAAIADFPWWQQYLREEHLCAQFDLLLNTANCSSLDCLRTLPEDVLHNATQKTYQTAYAKGAYGYGNFYYGPYVDGELLRDLPSREFEAGHFAKVPTWLSREGYEGVGFSNQSMKTVEEERVDLKTQFPSANESFMNKLYELYPSKEFNSTFFHREKWFGDFIIDCPTQHVGASIAASNTPVFKEIFNAGSQLHGSTGPFLSDLSYENTPGANVTISNSMRNWYVSFAIHADPNARSWSNVSKPEWPDYKTGEVMSINYTEIGAVDDVYYDDTKRCEFFWNNGETVQN